MQNVHPSPPVVDPSAAVVSLGPLVVDEGFVVPLAVVTSFPLLPPEPDSVAVAVAVTVAVVGVDVASDASPPPQPSKPRPENQIPRVRIGGHDIRESLAALCRD